MKQQKNELWIDTRLSKEAMVFLNNAISEENLKDNSGHLAGNISKSEYIEDKDNWFFEAVLKKLTEKLFYDDWDNYRKYHIVEKENPPPKFEMFSFWVNYMKQHEFNPIHHHGGLFSFVVFMKIPTHWKEQHALPISVNSNTPSASDFSFVWSKKDSKTCDVTHFSLSPEDEGRILFFPAWLSHLVYPFYGTEEERITISGNICLYDPNRPKLPEKTSELSGDVYEEKEKILEILQNTVRETREEWKWMKKEKKAEEKT